MKIDEKSSFAYFVYPFLFDEASFDERVAVIELAAWEGRKRPLKVWEREKFSEDDLLPHVAKYLNPPDDTQATAHMWAISADALQSPVGGLGWGNNSSIEWTLETSREDIPFSVSAVQFVLFCTGVGFLTVCASPNYHDSDSWLNFLHFFRFSHGQRGVRLNARRRVAFDEQTRTPEYQSFQPQSDNLVAQRQNNKQTLDNIIHLLLASGILPAENENWWKNVFVPGQLIPFSSLFIDEAPEEKHPELIYLIRNFFYADKEAYPSAEDLRGDQPSMLMYSQNQRFFFSLNGGGYIAFDAPRNAFFRAELPAHLKDQYYLLFLLALHQRSTLMMLLDQVANNWLIEGIGVEERKRSFDRIRNQLFAFTSRGYFAQAMQSENHHRVYAKWQEIFQVERLYQEISDEIHYMSDFLQSERDRLRQEYEENLSRTLNAIALFIGVPTITLTIVQAGFSEAGWPVTVYTSAGSVLLGGILYWIIKRRAGR